LIIDMLLLREELILIGFRDKEIEKVNQFYNLVSNKISGKFDTLIDICAGNGLASFIFQYYGFAEKSLMIDIKRPKRFFKLEDLFKKYNLNYSYTEKDILKDIEIARGSNVIISIHRCSYLSDKVIDIGLKHQLPFALMTCCHNCKIKDYKLVKKVDKRMLLYEEKEDYFDLVRKKYIEEHGRFCEFLEVSKKITPRNHVLISKI